MVWTTTFDKSPDSDPNPWLDLVLLSEFQRTLDRLTPLRVRNYMDCHHLDAGAAVGAAAFRCGGTPSAGAANRDLQHAVPYIGQVA